MNGDIDGWDLVEDVSPRQIQPRNISPHVHGPEMPCQLFESNADPSYPRFAMAPQYTPEEIQALREADLNEQRVQALGVAFVDVPRKTSCGDNYTRPRVEKLGYAFTQVPMNIKHEDWISMSKEDQEVYKAKIEPDTTPLTRKMQAISSLDVESLRPKWSWVRSPNGGDWLALEVIEDSGSVTDFISRSQIECLNLETRRGDPILLCTITGQRFTVVEYVNIIWSGKDLKEREGRFWVAPSEAPIQMLVGRSFTTDYPEILMEERPKSKPQGMLLTMQVKMKKGEQEQIDASRASTEKQARQLEEKRRQRLQDRQRAQKPTFSSNQRSAADISRFSKP